MKIEGATAIVTGAGSGLGEATASALADQGAKVALIDMNAERVNQVAARLGGLAVPCDVTNAEQGETAIAAIVEMLGVPRILVNCAGIVLARKTTGRDGPHSLQEFQKVLNVNVVGSFNMIRLMASVCETLDPLEGGERGVIISTASVAAFDGQMGQAAYAASKGAVAAMTLPIARDLSRAGIRVMTIAPGIFTTPMMASLPQEAQDSLGKQVPFPSRLGRPEEYAQLAINIIENQMLNGEVIRLDGAIRMGLK